MQTPSLHPREKTAPPRERESGRADATAAREQIRAREIEPRVGPRVEDDEARLFRPIVSIRSASAVDAPSNEAGFQVAPNDDARLLETGIGASASSRERTLAFPASKGAAPPDEVHIHIGRIEVTAVEPPRAAPRPKQNATFLEEYVKRRDGRAR